MNPNMNRRERRRAEALQNTKPLELAPAREDGRPLYYDIALSDRVNCLRCGLSGLHSLYGVGEAMMNDPANPPAGAEVGAMHTVCVHHLPDNAVIYNPRSNKCRNKAGDHTWEEAPRQEVPDALS